MKRFALGVACTVLAGFLLLLPAAPGPQSFAAGSGCLKIWKEKQVTKFVKKNGRLKKVTFIKRYQVCDPYQAPGPPRLGVAAVEWKFTLSRPRIKAGRLMLEYTNRGEDSHNLRVAPRTGNRVLGSVSDTEPEKVTTSEFQLKPGIYRMWCALPGHAKLGMKARLRVLK